MSFTTVATGDTVAAADVNQFKEHLEGGSSKTAPYHLKQSSGSFQVTLADAAGATFFRINDSAGVDVFHVTSDGDIVFAGTLTQATIILPTSAAPAQTAEGSIVWDSNDDIITVGDSSSRKSFYPSTGPLAWEHIDTQVLSGAAASVSFASISSVYKAFRLTAHMKNDASAASLQLRLNNDSGSNYDYQNLRVSTGAVAGAALQQAVSVQVVTSASLAANLWAHMTFLITKEAAADQAKVYAAGTVDTAANTPETHSSSGNWRNVADLINRIDILKSAGNFAVGSRFTLEGLQVTT